MVSIPDNPPELYLVVWSTPSRTMVYRLWLRTDEDRKSIDLCHGLKLGLTDIPSKETEALLWLSGLIEKESQIPCTESETGLDAWFDSELLCNNEPILLNGPSRIIVSGQMFDTPEKGKDDE